MCGWEEDPPAVRELFERHGRVGCTTPGGVAWSDNDDELLPAQVDDGPMPLSGPGANGDVADADADGVAEGLAV